MKRRVTGIFVAALVLASPVVAQRIELDGSSANGLRIGPSDTTIERAMEGGATVDIGNDGIAVDAGGSVRLGVDERSETVGGGISLGGGGAEEAASSSPRSAPRGASSGTTDDVTAEPDAAELHAPLSQMRLPSDPAEAADCLEADVFAQHRDAFMEAEMPDASVYIRRVDVSVCGYEPSRELMTYLNTMPDIRAGLEQMLIDPEQIVSAGWTDDAGLLIYTIDPAAIP